MNITIDKEFESLIPPLTGDEFSQLEMNIRDEGVRDPLVVWREPYFPQKSDDEPDPLVLNKDPVLLDGHNRYKICQKYGIPFETVEADIFDREDAKRWIILNQFGRRNLSAYDRSVLALKLKPMIAEQAKEQQGMRSDICQKSDKSIDTKKELAKVAGVSHDTIHKVEVIETKATPQTKQLVKEGEISINQAYQMVKQQTEDKKPHVVNNSGNNEWYTPSEFIEAARLTMGSIDLDPASNDIANNVVKASEYFTIETDGLSCEWHGNIWLNPPYSSDLIGRFIMKLVDERENYDQAVVLVNNATETEWFRKLITIADAVCFPKGRVKFYTPNGETGAPLQGQAVVYIGENVDEFLFAFSDIGWRCSLIEV